jgi:hypothetical protein
LILCDNNTPMLRYYEHKHTPNQPFILLQFGTRIGCVWIDPVPLASPLLLQLKEFFEQNNHGDLLLSPYAFLAITITTNKIYVNPTIWTFRVWLVDQTISSIRSKNSFFSQNMDLPVY